MPAALRILATTSRNRHPRLVFPVRRAYPYCTTAVMRPPTIAGTRIMISSSTGSLTDRCVPHVGCRIEDVSAPDVLVNLERASVSGNREASPARAGRRGSATSCVNSRWRPEKFQLAEPARHERITHCARQSLRGPAEVAGTEGFEPSIRIKSRLTAATPHHASGASLPGAPHSAALEHRLRDFSKTPTSGWPDFAAQTVVYTMGRTGSR